MFVFTKYSLQVVSVSTGESTVATYSDDKQIYSYLVNVTHPHIERKAYVYVNNCNLIYLI